MNKEEIQRRVLQGKRKKKLLELDRFEWNEKTKTFSTSEDNLVLNFKGIDGISFKTGSKCNFVTGDNCKILIPRLVEKDYKDWSFELGKGCSIIEIENNNIVYTSSRA